MPFSRLSAKSPAGRTNERSARTSPPTCKVPQKKQHLRSGDPDHDNGASPDSLHLVEFRFVQQLLTRRGVWYRAEVEASTEVVQNVPELSAVPIDEVRAVLIQLK